ncbi:hypothetical protein ACFQ22_00690 [Lentilactobacillus raoultii]|uniref:Alpha-ribazole kinase n=1 Tax=Lentilactobacillus raoultii TaxID=1987503 RepID=A0ABW3PGS0_9LACO|nr:hypothetical protein [Lentilactobacillus raoultii]
MKSKQYRDLSLIDLPDGEQLVIACDSSAGIGDKKNDMIQIDPAIMAGYSLRVPLMELICFNADPIVVIDTVGNEMTPTGERIIKGIKNELVKAGLEHIPLNGSTEDNMITKTTSLGVTIVGMRPQGTIRAITNPTLSVFQLGTPYVGESVKQHLSDIFSYDLVRKIRSDSAVYDMLPVGSKGIGFEIKQMAATHQLQVTPVISWTRPEIKQSAGPATVILIGVDEKLAESFHERYPELRLVAKLKRGVIK